MSLLFAVYRQYLAGFQGIQDIQVWDFQIVCWQHVMLCELWKLAHLARYQVWIRPTLLFCVLNWLLSEIKHRIHFFHHSQAIFHYLWDLLWLHGWHFVGRAGFFQCIEMGQYQNKSAFENELIWNSLFCVLVHCNANVWTVLTLILFKYTYRVVLRKNGKVKKVHNNKSYMLAYSQCFTVQ